MRHRGDFTDIFEALKVFPKGIADDDIVTISGKIYKWSKRRCTFVTDGVHVPEPGDSHPVITLFTSLTADGILTDFMGNKWQLAAWEERVTAPTITVQDVTTDSEYGYPSLIGIRNAVYLITIEDEDDECDIEYKIIKDGNEPAVWQPYDEPFVVKTNGVYQIAARAKKSGVADSNTTRSEAFQVLRKVYETGYGNIIVSQFSYGRLASTAGTAVPVVRYAQPVAEYYTDGTSASSTAITTGATISFRQASGTSALTALDTTTGEVTYTANSGVSERNIGAVEVAISLNGKTATKTENLTQNGIDTPIYIGKVPVTTLNASALTESVVDNAVSLGTLIVGSTREVTIQDAELGSVSLVVLIPSNLTKVGKKWNGINAYTAFNGTNAVNGTATTTIHGITYKIYGESPIIDASFTLKAE